MGQKCIYNNPLIQKEDRLERTYLKVTLIPIMVETGTINMTTIKAPLIFYCGRIHLDDFEIPGLGATEKRPAPTCNSKVLNKPHCT